MRNTAVVATTTWSGTIAHAALFILLLVRGFARFFEAYRDLDAATDQVLLLLVDIGLLMALAMRLVSKATTCALTVLVPCAMAAAGLALGQPRAVDLALQFPGLALALVVLMMGAGAALFAVLVRVMVARVVHMPTWSSCQDRSGGIRSEMHEIRVEEFPVAS